MSNAERATFRACFGGWALDALDVQIYTFAVPALIAVWHITAGYESAEAAAMRARMGAWDSEWSLRHMIQVLQRSILNAAIDPNSANHAQMREMVQTLKNWALLAA